MSTVSLMPSDIASICQMIAQATQAAEALTKARTVTRYGVDYCVTCGLAVSYCKGHAPADPPAKDGAESGLNRRIADCQAK